MPEILRIEISDEEMAAASKMTQPYRKQINETPALMSLLYDVDLLPEQIKLAMNACRMVAICECFKRMTPDQIQSLLEPGETGKSS